MARTPKIQGTDNPSPGNGSIEIVKDTVGDGVPGISDGLGNVLFVGDVVEVPRDVADVLIAKGFAQPADGSSFVAAKKRAVQIETAARQSVAKNAAVAAQSEYDDLPPELRALIQSTEADISADVIALFQSGDDAASIIRAYTR
jgi:hypothetical protein